MTGHTGRLRQENDDSTRLRVVVDDDQFRNLVSSGGYYSRDSVWNSSATPEREAQRRELKSTSRSLGYAMLIQRGFGYELANEWKSGEAIDSK
jgi:hypothetical protein